MCVWTALKLVFWITAELAVHAWRGAVIGCEFLLLLIEEWRRGANERADEDEFFRKEEESERREEFFRQDERPLRQETNPYRDALALFGLPEEFTRPALKLAYKRAIVTAHPDNPAGTGSTRAAQAVNGAYALLLRSRGWAR